MKGFPCALATALTLSLDLFTHAQDVAPRTLESAIRTATVYSDRAQIERSAETQLEKGLTTLAFSRLPGWIDEGSVRVTLNPASAGRIVDVRVERDYLARTSDKDLTEAERLLQEIADDLTVLDDELKTLAIREKHVKDVTAFSMEKLPHDTAAGRVDVTGYAGVVDFVTGTMQEILRARREIDKRRRELTPEFVARERRVAELRQRTQLEQATVLVTVDTPAAARAELGCTYMLPGAAWEPAHELRAEGSAPKSVLLRSYAVVTQTTGEDWTGASLAFSTQSSTGTIQIPELDTLLVGGGRTLRHLQGGATDTFQKARQKYELQNGLWNLYLNPNEDANVFAFNVNQQKEAQGRAAAMFQRLHQRGTTARFHGLTAPTVRSDGRAVRVPVGAIELAAVHRIVAAPEASLNAARTVELTNTGDQPLLPGRTSLFLDGGFLGNTDLDFVAKGEPFAAFLGVADQVKLARVLDLKRSTISRGRRTRIKAAFVVTAVNLSELPLELDLTDRIPVSDSKEIEVERVRLQPEAAPDSKGLLRWKVALAPGEERRFDIEYTVDYPSDFVQRARMKSAVQSQVLMPSADVAPSEESLSIQLDDLEQRMQ